LFFIIVETIADNQQYDFQTEKYKRINNKEELTNEYKRGYLTTGLYSIVRKPNYLAEQSIWVSFYLFSVAATNQWLNWSLIGSFLLVLLFQGSGKMTEKISIAKYPSYRTEYCAKVGRYNPMKGIYHMLVDQMAYEMEEMETFRDENIQKKLKKLKEQLKVAEDQKKKNGEGKKED